MQEWSDQALVLLQRPYGERDAILTVFSADHGRYSGLVRGGQSVKRRVLLQPGNLLAVRHRSRLASQLGNFSIETMELLAARSLNQPQMVLAHSSLAALLLTSLADRDPQPQLFAESLLCLRQLSGDPKGLCYGDWELQLLAALGYQVTIHTALLANSSDVAAFISPNSGRVIGRSAAGKWRNRLLPLPTAIADARPIASHAELLQVLNMTERLLVNLVYRPRQGHFPSASKRLRNWLQHNRLSILGPNNNQPPNN